jgi:hypothetical protein
MRNAWWPLVAGGLLVAAQSAQAQVTGGVMSVNNSHMS